MTQNYFKIPVNFYQMFEIRKLNWKNEDEVTPFIEEYNSPRSPIGSIFGECLQEVTGVALGTIHKPDPSSPCRIGEYLNDLPSLPLSERFLQWFESDLHERLKVRKFMLAEMVTVHPDYTGLGISDAVLGNIVDAAIQADCESLLFLVFHFICKGS